MDPFQLLPVDILEMIICLLPDLATLHDLYTASTSVFSLCHDEGNLLPFVETIMQKSTAQVRELMSWCMVVRINRSHYASFSNFKDAFREIGPQPGLRSQSLTTDHLCSLLAMSKNVRALASTYIQDANQFCLSLRPLRLKSKRYNYRARLRDDQPYKPCKRFEGEPFQPQDAGAASWYEVQRVYCALWRLVLYSTVRQSALEQDLDDVASNERFWNHLISKFLIEQTCTVTERLFPASTDISLLDITVRARACVAADQKTSRLSCTLPQEDVNETLDHPAWAYTEINNIYSILAKSPLRFVKVEVFRPFGFYIWDQRRMNYLGFGSWTESVHDTPPPPCNNSDEMFRIWSLLSEEQITEVEHVQKFYWPSLDRISVNISPYDIPRTGQ